MNTASGQRTGTAQSRAQLGTRGALTSSMGTTAAQGVALSTAVNVSDRPVTQQGMRGMKTSQGPARQVQDSSYYVGILRSKVSELTSEINSLQNEARQYERSVNEYGGLQKRHEALLNEVRNLEGTLADYNLAMDKARVSTDPAELNEYVHEFEYKNKQFAGEIDRIFVMKKQKDEETKGIEAQIRLLHEQAQRKINELEPDKLNRYNRLLDQSSELMQRQERLLQEVDAYGGQLAEHEGLSARQSYGDQFEQLCKRRARVQRDERGLCDELAIWELSDPKQALEQLKKRVEQQSRELKELDATSRELKDATKSSQKSLQELGDELTERTGESGGDKDKYDKLRQRDEEMALFIEEFDATRGSTLEDAGRARETIVALLEHVSLGLEQEHSMPSQQRLREMKDEATFKERQLESSQQTTSRLVHERRQREAELLKIENLDEKIGVELGSLKHKMERMRADMIEFDDTEGLRHRAAATISQLSRLLKEYQGRRESVKSQVTHLTQKYEQLKNKIQHSETAKTLSTLEAKLRTYAQTIFHLQEYVETKGRETDYKAVKENCNQLVDKLNAIARKTNEGGA